MDLVLSVFSARCRTLTGYAFRVTVVRCVFALCLIGLTIGGLDVRAQTAGEGAIQGTVLDPTGAVIPNARITATNVATHVATSRTSSGAGVFTISPLIPGTYSLRVEASGFRALEQDNLVVDALATLGINPVLTTGVTTETVTVSAAPPPLNTTNATLGTVMENETYSSLPIQMNNAQRDPTAFASLVPGAQAGTRSPIIGGTGNYLAEVYLDGLPVSVINQQGDNRLISQAVSVDAVDQFQVVTSTPPSEYEGAGIINFTMKSGGAKYHGQVSDFIRNTALDTWCYTCKLPNALGQQVKPVEHQNEFSASAGGKIPFTRGKGFFFVAYDKFHSRKGVNPVFGTVPTALMRTGDFTELVGSTTPILFDPTTNACVGSSCTRTPFQGLKNGVPTYNVLPASYLSPIALGMQQFLPTPNSPGSANGTVNNYYGGLPSGFDNHLIDARVDYDLTSRQRLSGVVANGKVTYAPLNGTANTPLNGPYTQGDYAVISPKVYDIEHNFAITERLSNQFKVGFTRFSQIIEAYTDGVTPYEATTLGITNLPPGQASTEFPGAAFATTKQFGTVQTQWTGNGAATATQITVPNTLTLVDNLQYTKGKHSMTFGVTMQWLQDNNAAQTGPSSIYTQTYDAYSTANYGTSGSVHTNALDNTTTGYSYASYLLGAVGSSSGSTGPSVSLQGVSETGGRYRPKSPYFQDDWKISPKLTVNLGLRWDYFPPYTEAKNRISFLNPNIVNPATGNMGALQFAGNSGGTASCGCSTPVHTYWKNFGPRVGLAYSVDDKTVFRAGFGEVFSRAGGVGGRAGAGNGTGQLGFNVTAQAPNEINTGPTAAPSFFLNNSAGFAALGRANTGFGGQGYALPANPGPSTASEILDTGNYVTGTGAYVSPSSITYADPYISGRAPEFNFWNVGLERSITNNITLAVNYVGSESHFVVSSASNPRGYWTNQLNPTYLAALGGVSDTTGSQSILKANASPANIAKAQSVLSSVAVPYSAFAAAAAANSSVTIAQMLTAFPQYSTVSDIWGNNVANISYNAFQLALVQRKYKGLTFNANYTFSKNIGDDGTFRSGFDIPGAALSGGGKGYHMDRIERSWTTVSSPQNLHVFGVYDLPFGKGQMGSDHFLVRALAGGWSMGGIYTYTSGTPLAILYGGCTAPGLGQCMPDVNMAAAGYLSNSARVNGSWGKAPGGNTAATIAKVQYIDVNAFKAPQAFGFGANGTSNPINLIGNAPRTKPLNLSNPGTQDLDLTVHRAFSLPKSMKLMIEVDCLNVTNKVTFGGINQTWAANSTSFGTTTSANSNSRDFQLAGHFSF
jgi:hypothetical protein